MEVESTGIKFPNWWASILSYFAYKNDLCVYGIWHYEYMDLDEPHLGNVAGDIFVIGVCIWLGSMKFCPKYLRTNNRITSYIFELWANLCLNDLIFKVIWVTFYSETENICALFVDMTEFLHLTYVTGLIQMDTWLLKQGGRDATRLVFSLFVLTSALKRTQALPYTYEKYLKFFHSKYLDIIEKGKGKLTGSNKVARNLEKLESLSPGREPRSLEVNDDGGDSGDGMNGGDPEYTSLDSAASAGSATSTSPEVMENRFSRSICDAACQPLSTGDIGIERLYFPDKGAEQREAKTLTAETLRSQS